MKIRRIMNVEAELNQVQVGDRITIADSEWKVLDIVDGKVLIWKCTNVEDRVFNENNSNNYEGSDIQNYLQDDFKEGIPLDILEKVTDEGFFLLTLDQVKKYMPVPSDRTATDPEGYNTWWWTSTPYGGIGYTVRYIYPTGLVNGKTATTSIGVAPACWLNL